MSSTVLPKPAMQSRGRMLGISLLVAYLALYAAILFAMVRYRRFDASDSLGVFVVLGIGFSLVAWLLTIGITPLPYDVRRPKQEISTLLVYLIPLAAFIAYGFSAIHRWVPSEPTDSLAILVAKLAVFVAIPAWLVMRFGYKPRDLAPVSTKTSHMLVFVGMAFVLLVFQSVAGRGLKDISEARVPADVLLFGMPLVFLWLMIEVGVVEEFFSACCCSRDCRQRCALSLAAS